MSTDDAQAAGQGGNVTILAPQSQDEVHRQSAASELAAYLACARTMIARCEAMSKASRGDRLGPIHAAARLMNANAQVARALAHVALVESRHRTIVEKIQSPAPKNPQLNSTFPSGGEQEDARAELERRLDARLESIRREKERLEGLAIDSAI